jgi:hypothetical protein
MKGREDSTEFACQSTSDVISTPLSFFFTVPARALPFLSSPQAWPGR